VWQGRQSTISNFFEKPTTTQVAKFRLYSIDDQYAIYLYGNQRLEPPAQYLAAPFGAEGRKVVCYLSQRLTRTSSDATIRDIILVFSRMSLERAYNVGKDVKLMQLLKTSLARIRDPGWKKIAEGMLASIR
jgi:hypothetical protein